MPPPTTRASNVRLASASRSRVIQECAVADSIVSSVATTEEVRSYWEQHIHDLAITTHPVGSRAFFEDLDQYHFEKLHHLLRLLPLFGLPRPSASRGRRRA